MKALLQRANKALQEGKVKAEQVDEVQAFIAANVSLLPKPKAGTSTVTA